MTSTILLQFGRARLFPLTTDYVPQTTRLFLTKLLTRRRQHRLVAFEDESYCIPIGLIWVGRGVWLGSVCLGRAKVRLYIRWTGGGIH